jgi:hypothetical protein
MGIETDSAAREDFMSIKNVSSIRLKQHCMVVDITDVYVFAGESANTTVLIMAGRSRRVPVGDRL